MAYNVEIDLRIKKPSKSPVNKRYLQELIVCTPYYLLGIKAVDTKAINTSVALIHITTTRASLLPLFERKDAYCVVSIALHCIALYCLVLPSIHCLALPSMHCLVLLSMRCILISDNTTVNVGCLYICDLSGLHSQGRRNNARRFNCDVQYADPNINLCKFGKISSKQAEEENKTLGKVLPVEASLPQQSRCQVLPPRKKTKKTWASYKT